MRLAGGSHRSKVILWACGASTAVVCVSFVYLLIGWPKSDIVDTAFGFIIYSGGRMSEILFAEGVHAGIPFSLVLMIVNWLIYALISFALISIFHRNSGRNRQSD